MSLYEAVLKRLLKESQLDIGNVQFSPNRIDGAPREEPNTPTEDKLYRDLLSWISSATIDPDSVEVLKGLMSSSKHGQFFREPPIGSEVYRGMKVTKEVISGWTGLPSEKIADSDDAVVDFTLQPKSSAGGLASWSYDMSVAEDFAYGSGKASRRGNYGVVLVAQVKDNSGVFLDLDHITSKVRGFQKSSAWEQEVLALGPVRIDQLVWMRLHD